jgi:hypothetical protein
MFEECPHCHTKVFPKDDRICPACSKKMDQDPASLNGVCLIAISEEMILPKRCLQCNEPTDDRVDVEAKVDRGTWTPADPGILGGYGLDFYSAEMSPTVTIAVPFCRNCHERSEPVLLGLDPETNRLLFTGHCGFQEELKRMNEPAGKPGPKKRPGPTPPAGKSTPKRAPAKPAQKMGKKTR